ncbi:Retrovirus-related Pol polyprotein from transposon RE1 [Vitis vinifera]|uniref:Retrovirus-related Pol polyprotein from transposon RE1 n=1 Tax=Vitis vinifera TaxID=29760 RepID=A0A438FEB6_VITVI|nr:Retrovirus-related Pol polyprotein from transposon RE1 [Vitis vinifera]
MATKSSIFFYVISGSPIITSEKLLVVKIFILIRLCGALVYGSRYEDHLVTQEAAIPEAYKTCFKFWNHVKGLYTNDIQRLYKIDKFFMVLTLIGLRPDLETVRDQILAVPPFHPWMMHLLASSCNRGRGQRPHCTYSNKLGHTRDWCYQLHGRPPRTAHVTQSSDPQPPSSSTSQGISLTGSEYDDYLHYQATKSTSMLLLPRLDLFSSITTTSALPTVTLANGSQTVAKALVWHILSLLCLSLLSFILLSVPLILSPSAKSLILLTALLLFLINFVTLQDREYKEDNCIGRESQGLYHLTSPSTPAVCISTYTPLLIHSRLGHPSLSKFRKMVPRFSSLLSLTCESCQLGKHTRVSFPKRLNNRAKSPFKFVHTDVWGPCRTASTLGFQYFVTFIDDYSRYKLSAKATKCIFLGYSRLQKGYHCYSSETRHYFLSIDVTFFKDSPFFSTSESLPVSKVLPLPIISPPNAVSSRPLQVYHHRHRVAVPPSLAEVPADSLPIPSTSPTLALPPSTDLPIALWKSTPEALSHPGWRQAMVDEMAALHSNGTWDLVVLPSGKSIVGCRWVYIVKVGPNGQVDRLKASLVAKGYTQIYGSDYDIKNAFLHGDLAEKAYMEQPPGFVAQGESGLVCRLHRSLYGLKQSPQAWFSRFSSVIQEFDMFRSTTDHSVSIITLRGNTKDLGKFKYFLGIEIAQSNSGVVLSQRKYALDILEETSMLDCKLIDTPIDPNVKLIPGQEEPLGVLGDIGDFTPGQGVLYENRGHTQVVGYIDADWVGSPTDRRSTSGQVLSYGSATCELIWLKHLLRELRFGKDEQMKFIYDNQVALHIASNPVFHEMTKHIEVTVTSLERRSHQDVWRLVCQFK